MIEPSELAIAGYWLDPALVLPPRSASGVESGDVLICVRTFGVEKFTVGHYNYVLVGWVTDIGRYPTIECWGYIPKKDTK